MSCNNHLSFWRNETFNKLYIDKEKSSKLISTYMGWAPVLKVAIVEYPPALATVITSSPNLTPKERKAISKASVPFATPIQY